MKFKSLRGRLTFFIMLVIVSVTIVRMEMIFFVRSGEMLEEMKQDISTLTEIGSNAMEGPLWDFNLENLEEISETLLLDENVVKIIVTDGEGILLVEKKKNFKGQEELNILKEEKQIYFDGELLGSLELHYTDSFYIEEKNRQILHELVLGLLEIVLLGMITLIISARTTKPLLHLVTITDNIAKGKLDNKIKTDRIDEIGSLERAVEGMQGQLARQIFEIETNHDEIEKNYQETIMALANSIDASDHYTRDHCDRVQKYSLLIGEKIGLDTFELKNLHMASILHDIGKIGVPLSILNKESPLTKEEFDEIKKHSEIGFQILKDIEFLKISALIIRQHHERVDGTGYNFGLVKDEILKEARIISITDAYDAMMSSRAYRKIPLTRARAMAELVEGKNRQFDGDLVEVFIRILEEEAEVEK